MDTLSFLQRVLPSEGYYVTTLISPEGKVQQGFFDTVEELAQACKRLSTSQPDKNVYFAVSAFGNKGNRKQDNVRATKLVAVDVDCGDGKPFPTWKEGLQALGKFVSEMRLPKPLIIHSGNGLHVYWVLTEELEPEHWKPLAEAMKEACVAKGFEVDPAVPADSARVLRPVGTTNTKGGNEVKMLVEQHGRDNFHREILHLCDTKGVMSYLEAKEQFDRNVLLDDSYYNGIIQCKIHRSHVKNLA